MTGGDGGLATEYWKQYYTSEEVDELIDRTTTTTYVSGLYPIHLRIAAQALPAPTVVLAHGLILYGTISGRLILPFARAGFNVVQFDFPGFGQSGGPRGGTTLEEMCQAWRDVLQYARSRFGTSLYIMGIAEDGILGYYASANSPDVRAMTLHTLIERGEPESTPWVGGRRAFRAKRAGLRALSLIRPSFRLRGTRAIPWDTLFAGPGDDDRRRLLRGDPLAMQWITARFAYSFVAPHKPPVRFEECRTPVQLVVSELNPHWRLERMQREYERLACPKELVSLEGRPHWELNREFQELYCSHAIRWFGMHGAWDNRPGVVG